MDPVLDCVFIETTTACTRRCDFCTHAYLDIVPHFMHETVFRKAIADLAEMEFAGRLALYLNGEPLLDRRLERWIAIGKAHCPEAFSFINTNGDLLTRERAITVFESGLDGMKVNCYSKRAYARAEQLKARLPEALGRRMLVSDATLMTDWSSRGGIVTSTPKRHYVYPDALCPRPFRQLYVTVTGRVALCCTDDQCCHPVGDAVAEHLREIWEGPALESVRRGFRRQARTPEICYRCDLPPTYQDVQDVRRLFDGA